MNWLDIVLIVALAGGLVVGLRLKLIGTAFITAGVIAGWQVAGHFADDLGELLPGPALVDTSSTFAWFVLILAAFVLLSIVAFRFIRPALRTSTLGLSDSADTLGAAIVGLVLAALVCGALITGLARLAYDFDPPVIRSASPYASDAREGLSSALVGSTLTRAFVGVVYNVPGDAIGFVPGDFGVSIAILKGRIDSGFR